MSNFKILSGLPAYGELPKQFSATGMGTHSEGFIVQFFSPNNSFWIGNFQRGLTSLDQAIQHPDMSSVIVIAGGECYVVDTESRELKDNFGGAFETILSIREKEIVILGTSTDFTAIDPNGIKWESRRISWDGIRSLKLENEQLLGEAWSYEDTWLPFALNINTGKHKDGAQFD